MLPQRQHKAERVAEGLTPSEEESCRANVYSLLGALLANPPDAGLLKALAEIDDADPESEGMTGAWMSLKEAAGETRERGVEQEFNDLFIGVGRGEVVPYGSYYLTGFLNEKPLAVLRRELDALGVERQDDVKEPEDHAAALCETMNMLIGEGEELPFERQREFFLHHVGSWMGAFFADLRTSPSASFYVSVGRLGEEFMAFETKYFSMLV